jgi:hypothetical protein
LAAQGYRSRKVHTSQSGPVKCMHRTTAGRQLRKCVQAETNRSCVRKIKDERERERERWGKKLITVTKESLSGTLGEILPCHLVPGVCS